VEANSTGGQGSRRAVAPSDDDDDDDNDDDCTQLSRPGAWNLCTRALEPANSCVILLTLSTL
jgi:hypothetical protein